MNIEVLTPEETQTTLLRGKDDGLNAQIEAKLMPVIDTSGSIFVPGLNDPKVNALRTRMYRRNIMITVRRVTRNGARGHVIQGRTIRPEEQG